MASYALPTHGWVSESGTSDFGLPFGWLSESEAGASAVTGDISATVDAPSSEITAVAVVLYALDGTVPIPDVAVAATSNVGAPEGSAFSGALPQFGWIIEKTLLEGPIPFGGWISETGTSSTSVYADLTATVAAPSAELAATITVVAQGGALPFVALLPNISGWISETLERALSIPGDGWISETPPFTGESADIAAPVPAPSAAVGVQLFAKATITATVPPPYAYVAVEAVAWEIGQIFDNVPAPVAYMSVGAIEVVRGTITESAAGPSAAMAAFATQHPVLATIVEPVPAPSASVNVFIVQTWPFADIDGIVDGPSAAMDGTVMVAAAMDGVVHAPSCEMFIDASFPMLADIGSEIPGPVAAMTARIWGVDVFPDEPLETFTLHPPAGPTVVIVPPTPPLGS